MATMASLLTYAPAPPSAVALRRLSVGATHRLSAGFRYPSLVSGALYHRDLHAHLNLRLEKGVRKNSLRPLLASNSNINDAAPESTGPGCLATLVLIWVFWYLTGSIIKSLMCLLVFHFLRR